jgi:hypothetical protein
MRIPGLRSLGSLCLASMLVGSQLAACNDTGTQDVYMSPDTGGQRRRTEFVTDSEAINLIVKYSTGREDLTIRAEFFAVELEPDSIDQPLAVDGSAESLGTSGIGTVQAFTLKRKDGVELPKPNDPNAPDDVIDGQIVEPWPVGDFRARVLFDDEEVAVVPFKISWSECPSTMPAQNTPCRQFKPDGNCVYFEGTVSQVDCACANHIIERKFICTASTSG